MASVKADGIVERILSCCRLLVAGVGDPAVGLKQHCWAKVFFAVPPVAWARCAAACAENTLVETVELGTILLGLSVFTAL